MQHNELVRAQQLGLNKGPGRQNWRLWKRNKYALHRNKHLTGDKKNAKTPFGPVNITLKDATAYNLKDNRMF